ncbi:hypothetical protein ETB97_005975 [Aspergillus alliaceus]|uniref:Uncharacterized protein n=1 Tax=Petromyces alliaceus TaxID=209559 RepID=A0A8H5ZVW4_PETAA|nr:hypothetical protein ETB97_005975 [Aspergillus burnettii]
MTAVDPCRVPGLGSLKKQVTAAGSNTMDLAIAMLETNDMSTNYPYGDRKPGDSTNFSIFKQDWYMLHHSVSKFQGQSVSQVSNGATLNKDLRKDIKAHPDGEHKLRF